MMRAESATLQPLLPRAMPAMSTPFRRLLGTGVLCAVSVCQAAGPPRGLGDGNGSGPVLTREQLRECVAQQSRIAASHAEAVKAHATLGAEQAQLEELGKQLASQAGAVDLNNVDAVAAYNAKVLARQQQADAYAAKAAAVEAQGAALQTRQTEFLKGCDNRRFDPKDAAAVGIGK